MDACAHTHTKIVSLDYPLWCWEEETVAVEITPDLVPTLKFVQTGFAMSYSISHDITVLVRCACTCIYMYMHVQM